MSFAAIVKGTVQKIRKKLRQKSELEKIPGDLYGYLPIGAIRFQYCRRAFEAGLDLISVDETLCARMVERATQEEMVVWWKELARLTFEERLAVYRRVQVFAKAKLDKMK